MGRDRRQLSPCLRAGGTAMQGARHSSLVIEPRADADQSVRRRARTELEGRRQPSVSKPHGLCARGNSPATESAGEADANLPRRGPADMHDEHATAQRLAEVDRRLGTARARPAWSTTARAVRRDCECGARRIGRITVACRVGQPNGEAPCSGAGHRDSRRSCRRRCGRGRCRLPNRLLGTPDRSRP